MIRNVLLIMQFLALIFLLGCKLVGPFEKNDPEKQNGESFNKDEIQNLSSQNNTIDTENNRIDSIKADANVPGTFQTKHRDKSKNNTYEKSDYLNYLGDSISKYDDLIKTYANEINWDWRLLSALVYQESRFNPKANSWAGANGLMQIMPRTAERLGVEDSLDPTESVKGGTKFLKILWDRFDEVKDSTQRKKFCLAAYNCGYSHVVDAQRLANAEGYKDDVWDGHVEQMILKLSYPENYTKPFIRYGYVRGKEPYKYVVGIFNRYEYYKQYIN